MKKELTNLKWTTKAPVHQPLDLKPQIPTSPSRKKWKVRYFKLKLRTLKKRRLTSKRYKTFLTILPSHTPTLPLSHSRPSASQASSAREASSASGASSTTALTVPLQRITVKQSTNLFYRLPFGRVISHLDVLFIRLRTFLNLFEHLY